MTFIIIIVITIIIIIEKTSTWCRKPVCYDELKVFLYQLMRHQEEFFASIIIIFPIILI